MLPAGTDEGGLFSVLLQQNFRKGGVGRIRHFLGDIAPTGHGVTAYVHGVVAPDLQHLLRASDRTGGAPQGQEGVGHLLVLLPVGLVVDEIDARTGAVVFTGGVGRGRIAQTAHVFRHGLGRESLYGTFEAVADVILRCSADQPLGIVIGRDEEEPVMRGGGHLLIDDLEHLRWCPSIACIHEQRSDVDRSRVELCVTIACYAIAQQLPWSTPCP